MNKQTVSIFTIIAVLDILFKIASFLFWQFTESYTLYLVLDLLSRLCFLTLIFFIGRDLRDNYMKQIWQVYFFIGYSLLFYTVTVTLPGAFVSLSIMSLLYLIFSINVAVFFINSVYRFFGIVFLSAVFLAILVPWVLGKILPVDKVDLVRYAQLLPLVYPVALIYTVRGEMNKVYEQADSIASIEAET